MKLKLTGFDHIVLGVRDLAGTVAFYRDVGMEPREERPATGRILSVYFRGPDGNLVEVSNRL